MKHNGQKFVIKWKKKKWKEKKKCASDELMNEKYF